MQGIQRNLVREILRECPPHLTPNKDFVAFLVDLLLLDPNWGITEENFERKHIQNFVNTFINNLDTENMDLSVLQMQFSFRCYLQNMSHHTEIRKQKLFKNLSPIKNCIFNAQKPEGESDKSKLMNKFVYYVTLISGMGNPRHEKVFAEASAALRSVFHESDMMEFIGLRQQTKERQLLDLAKLVSGVRLFNKYCHKGGIGIQNLHKLLKTSVQKLNQNLQQNVIYIVATLNTLTEVIKKSYKIVHKDHHHQMVRTKDLSEHILKEENDLEIIFNQYQVFTLQLLDELEAFKERMNHTYENYRAVLREAHEKIESRIAVSVTVAYPIFRKLSDLWIQMQDQVIELSVIRAALKSIDDTTSAKLQKTARSDKSLDSMEVDLCETRSSSLFVVSSESKRMTIFLRKSMAERKDLKFEFQGFCPWVLVETGGALIPGLQYLGVVDYKNKYYIVSSQEAYTEFSKNPEQYIMRVLSLARAKPQLILFLNLKDELENVRNQCQLVKEMKVVRKKREIGSQTNSSYEVPPKVVKSYNWNLWDYKRDALSLLRMMTNKTKSTQTVNTHSRKPMCVQTFVQISSTTQTAVDHYSNTPNPSMFIAGLRGRKDNNQFVMDLTLSEA